MKQKLWEARPDQIEKSHMLAFMRYVQSKEQISLPDWPSLYKWSVRDIAAFWRYFADFAQISWDTPPRAVFTPGSSFQKAEWFEGGSLNFAKNILDNLSEGIVISCHQEGRPVHHIEKNELKDKVAAISSALRHLGVKKGDHVAGVVANASEALIAMLATASLGAVWSSCSPDFGVAGIVDRLSQVKPKVLFATSVYQYGGKTFDCVPKITEVVTKIGNGVQLIYLGDPFEALLSDFAGRALRYESVSFSDPLYILFSSGTTGIPKGIVHGVGGTLLQHKKELLLHSDFHPTDSLLFFTTCGWMMWNWMATALGVGMRVVTFDGSPSYPSVDHLFAVADQEEVTALGLSPKYLSALMANNIDIAQRYSLRSLKSILSTGSVLSGDHYHYIYKKVKEDVHLASISGGTDIVSCFVLGNPLVPVYEGEIQGPGLGMAVEAWSDEGKSLVGAKGELVCTKPFVSMPIYFLGDETGKKYHDSYFNHFAGKDVWRHGDYIQIDANLRIQIFGRSDATLNPGGVRIGTSEIYRCVDAIAGIKDSVVIGYDHKDEVYIILFVVLSGEIEWSEAFSRQIGQTIRQNLTPRHVPSHIFQVPEIPYTVNGKKVELAVKNILHNQPVVNQNSLVNPSALSHYEGFSRVLRSFFEKI